LFTILKFAVLLQNSLLLLQLEKKIFSMLTFCFCYSLKKSKTFSSMLTCCFCYSYKVSIIEKDFGIVGIVYNPKACCFVAKQSAFVTA
jgi:hypothetical protein